MLNITHPYDSLYVALRHRAGRIRNANLRDAVDGTLVAGLINANDTVFLERVRPVAEWERIFIDSIGTHLAYLGDNRRVGAWFAKHGINF